VEDLVSHHPIEAPIRRSYRQVGGEATSEAGPMTDAQSAIPAIPSTNPRSPPHDGMLPHHNIGLAPELFFAFQACHPGRATEQQQNDIDTVRNYISTRDRAEGVTIGRASFIGMLLRVVLAQLLLVQAERQGVPFAPYEELSRLIRSGLFQ